MYGYTRVRTSYTHTHTLLHISTAIKCHVGIKRKVAEENTRERKKKEKKREPIHSYALNFGWTTFELVKSIAMT